VTDVVTSNVRGEETVAKRVLEITGMRMSCLDVIVGRLAIEQSNLFGCSSLECTLIHVIYDDLQGLAVQDHGAFLSFSRIFTE